MDHCISQYTRADHSISQYTRVDHSISQYTGADHSILLYTRVDHSISQYNLVHQKYILGWFWKREEQLDQKMETIKETLDQTRQEFSQAGS